MSAAAESTESTPETAASPEIRVARGNPTADEVAAVVAVLAAVSAAATQLRSSNDQRRDKRPGGWTARERGVHAALRPGPGGWRASGLPRAQ